MALWNRLKDRTVELSQQVPQVEKDCAAIEDLASRRQEAEGRAKREGSKKAKARCLEEASRIERQIAPLAEEHRAFKAGVEELRRLILKILKRYPNGEPAVGQLSALSLVKQGLLNFDDLRDDLDAIQEVADQMLENVNTDCAVGSAAAGSAETTPKDRVGFAESALPKRRRGRPQKFSPEQKRAWLEKRDQGASIRTLAREMYPGSEFNIIVSHRIQSSLSRWRKQYVGTGEHRQSVKVEEHERGPAGRESSARK